MSAALASAFLVLLCSKRACRCWGISAALAPAFLVLFCSKRACRCWGISAALASAFLVLFCAKRACRCWGVSATLNNFILREFGSSRPIHFRFLVALDVSVVVLSFSKRYSLVESFQPLVAVEESQVLLRTPFLGNSGQVVQYISTFLRFSIEPLLSCLYPNDILFVESFQPLVAVEESQLLLTTSFLGNSGQVVQYISAFLWPFWKQVHQMCPTCSAVLKRLIKFIRSLSTIETSLFQLLRY
jgi:hypothetical protein